MSGLPMIYGGAEKGHRSGQRKMFNRAVVSAGDQFESHPRGSSGAQTWSLVRQEWVRLLTLSRSSVPSYGAGEGQVPP